MKLTTSPFKSDVLTLTKSELKQIADGEELRVSALYIRLEEEPKPDVVEHMSIYRNLNRRYENERPVGESMHTAYVGNVQLTWDGTTGKLKSAEVI